MAIVNRDLGLSQQRDVFNYASPAGVSLLVATGVSLAMFNVPYACIIEAAAFSAIGLSGSPQYTINAQRFTSGGVTVIALGISNIVVAAAHGVSGGAQGWSGLRVSGNSLLQLQSGDLLAVTSSAANTAATSLTVSVVLRRTADIVSILGMPT